MTELTFLKVLMLIRQVHQKSFIICHFWYILDKGFKFQPDVCNVCYDVLLMYLNLSNIAILNIQGADYSCIINRISESKAMALEIVI